MPVMNNKCDERYDLAKYNLQYSATQLIITSERIIRIGPDATDRFLHFVL